MITLYCHIPYVSLLLCRLIQSIAMHTGVIRWYVPLFQTDSVGRSFLNLLDMCFHIHLYKCLAETLL